MATLEKVISFRILKEQADELDNAYGSANAAATRILLALPFLRNRTFDELKGQFTPAELCFLINMMKLIDFDPRFTTNKAAMLQEVKDRGTYNNPFKVDYMQLIGRMDKLSASQLYFLFDFCKAFWERGEIQEGDLEEYITTLK